MSTILHYRVEISDLTGIVKDKNSFVVKTLNVIGQNEMYMVVDDLYFTSIKLKKDKYFICLNVSAISTNINCNIFGNRIAYSLYTHKKRTAASIRKEIETEMKNRFGFFMNGLDLSFITDKD